MPEPAWLNDPANAELRGARRSRSQRGAAAARRGRRRTLGAGSFLHSIPNRQNTRQEVIRVDWQMNNSLALDRTLYARSVEDDRGRRTVFQHRACPTLRRRSPMSRARFSSRQLMTTIRSNILNEASVQYLEQRDRLRVWRRRAQHAIGVWHHHPGALPGKPQRPDPVHSVAGRPLGDRRQPAVRQRIQEPHVHRQPLVAAREPLLQDGGCCWRSSRRTRSPGAARRARFNFRAGGGFTAFQNFLRGNRDGACGANCDYTEPAIEVDSHTCARTATSSSRRTPGACGRTSRSSTACAMPCIPPITTRTTS